MEDANLSPHRSLFWAALEGTVRHPLRLWVTIGCLVSVLTPFLVGLAILEGVREEARASVDGGPDLLVTGYEHGRNTGLAADLVAKAREIPQVLEARGRIVGRVEVEDKLVTLVGLEPLAGDKGLARHRDVPKPGEVWLGDGLVTELRLAEGATLVLADQQQVSLKVTKRIGADAALAFARLAVISLADAQVLYQTPGRISDMQIWIKGEQPGDPTLQAAFGLRLTGVPLRIQTKRLVREYVDRGFSLKGGTFLGLYVVALALVIPALLVTSGFGMSTRRREVALLKLLGFSVLDLLEMAVWEVLAMALLATLIAFVLAWAWVRPLGGALIASFFIAELEHGAFVTIPASFGPGPLAIALALSVILLASGVIVTTWRSASASPAEVLK